MNVFDIVSYCFSLIFSVQATLYRTEANLNVPSVETKSSRRVIEQDQEVPVWPKQKQVSGFWSLVGLKISAVTHVFICAVIGTRPNFPYTKYGG